MAEKTFGNDVARITKVIDSLIKQLKELYIKWETTQKQGIKNNTEHAMKSMIKKIQRERDTIKRMLNTKLGQRQIYRQILQEYKDKVEAEMQAFRKFEGELKTKAFSDKNLERKNREGDGDAVEKVVCQTVEKLKTVLEMAETQASASRRSRRRRAKSVSWFPSISLLKFHLDNLEDIHRAICVGEIDTQLLEDFGFLEDMNSMCLNLDELDEYAGYWEIFKGDIYADFHLKKSTTNVEEAKKCKQELKQIQANKIAEEEAKQEEEFEGFRPKNQQKSPVHKTKQPSPKSLTNTCQPETGSLPVPTNANSLNTSVAQYYQLEEGNLPPQGVYVAKQGQLPPTNNTFEATQNKQTFSSMKKKVIPPRMMSKYFSNQDVKPSTPLSNQSRFGMNPVRKLNFGMQQPSQPAIVTQLSAAPMPPPSMTGFVQPNLSNSNSALSEFLKSFSNNTVSAPQANNVSSALSASLLNIYTNPPPSHFNMSSLLQTLAQNQAQQLASQTNTAQNQSLSTMNLNSTFNNTLNNTLNSTLNNTLISTPSRYSNNYVLQSTPQPGRRVNTTMMPPPGLTPPHPSQNVAAQGSRVYPSYHHRQTLRNISNQNRMRSQNNGSGFETAKRGDVGKMLKNLNNQLDNFASRNVGVKGPESMNMEYGSTFQIGTQQHYCLPRPKDFMQSIINARYDPRYQVKLPRETARAKVNSRETARAEENSRETARAEESSRETARVEESSAPSFQVTVPREPAESELSYKSAVEESDLLADKEVEETMKDEAGSLETMRDEAEPAAMLAAPCLNEPSGNMEPYEAGEGAEWSSSEDSSSLQEAEAYFTGSSEEGSEYRVEDIEEEEVDDEGSAEEEEYDEGSAEEFEEEEEYDEGSAEEVEEEDDENSVEEVEEEVYDEGSARDTEEGEFDYEGSVEEVEEFFDEECSEEEEVDDEEGSLRVRSVSF